MSGGTARTLEPRPPYSPPRIWARAQGAAVLPTEKRGVAKKHPGHAEALWQWLFGAERPRKRLLVRNIRLSGPALARISALSPSELAAFAALLLRLDADPVSNSEMLTVKPPVPGLRWTSFLGYTVVFTLDPSQDSIRIASVR